MKTVYKICLANVLIVLVVTAIAAINTGSAQDFLSVFALFGLAWGIISIIIGVIILISRKKQWGQGFLMASAILFLIGFALCSSHTVKIM